MRVLQIGFGNIGSAVFQDYRETLKDHTYQIVDLVQPIPQGYEWDRKPVDLAIVMVDTRPSDDGDGFDYGDLLRVLEEYQALVNVFVIRSTLGLGFFEKKLYRDLADRIGFSPEFNGTTKWANRADTPLGFDVFTENVPHWFVKATGMGKIIYGDPKEVALAKLAENAFLALKVTFFHEMILGAEKAGLDGNEIRRIVTTDPRIGEANSYLPLPGWSSHCYNKDVPAFAELLDTEIVRAAIKVNQEKLLPLRTDRR